MNISDIQAETRALCDADSTSLPDATLLRRLNAAYEETVGKLLSADGTWQFDDSNYTDLPIGTTTLVAGQQDYTFDSTLLMVERVEVLNSSGQYMLLKPLDKSQIDWTALSEFDKTNGLPYWYDKQGSSILLYPAPLASAVTLAAGLKVYFQRTAAVFTSGEVSTGTKTPGFASPYHILLCYKAAIPYCISYKKDRVAFFQQEILRLEQDLLKFYAKRQKDVRSIMKGKRIKYI